MAGGSVQGYSTEEGERLNRQAGILSGFIHATAIFAPGSRVLEAGCGVGAQTLQLAQRNPRVQFVALDRFHESLAIARERVAELALTNVQFQLADIHALPFADAEFDGAFLCFVLEHLAEQRLIIDAQDSQRRKGRMRRFGSPAGRGSQFAHGEHQPHGCAFAGFAFDLDRAFVALHHAGNHCQAQASRAFSLR